MHLILISALAATLALAGCANMSETQRGTATGAALGGIAGAVAGNIWSSKMEKQKQEMEQATQGTGVQVSQTADNRLKLDIPSDISFDTNRSDIRPNFRPILDKFAASLVDNPATTVTIVGHTDNTGSDAINNPLSIDRAARTRDYLSTRGVAPARFTIDGRGSHEPVASNETSAGRAQNRRVEIYVAEPQR